MNNRRRFKASSTLCEFVKCATLYLNSVHYIATIFHFLSHVCDSLVTKDLTKEESDFFARGAHVRVVSESHLEQCKDPFPPFKRNILLKILI